MTNQYARTRFSQWPSHAPLPLIAHLSRKETVPPYSDNTVRLPDAPTLGT